MISKVVKRRLKNFHVLDSILSPIINLYFDK